MAVAADAASAASSRSSADPVRSARTSSAADRSESIGARFEENRSAVRSVEMARRSEIPSESAQMMSNSASACIASGSRPTRNRAVADAATPLTAAMAVASSGDVDAPYAVPMERRGDTRRASPSRDNAATYRPRLSSTPGASRLQPAPTRSSRPATTPARARGEIVIVCPSHGEMPSTTMKRWTTPTHQRRPNR